MRNGTTILVQRLKAPSTRAGNPQRLWLAFHADGFVAGVFDEGYAGKPVELRNIPELPEIEIPVREYKRLLDWGMRQVELRAMGGEL